MLGHLWLGDVEQTHEVVDRLLAAGERVEDLPPSRLRDRIERVGGGRCTCHAIIIFLYGHMSTVRNRALPPRRSRSLLGRAAGAAPSARPGPPPARHARS